MAAAKLLLCFWNASAIRRLRERMNEGYGDVGARLRELSLDILTILSARRGQRL